MQLTGAQIVIECLKEQGVKTVFGFPGGAILNVFDALYMHRDEIEHVLVSHEQGASHAADGYARATGKVGVCLATSGPGATNLVTGIATAYMDSVPMVAITCNVGLSLLGKDSFQEVDIAGITTPITKHNFIVKDIDQLAPTIRRAFMIAGSGRPGPVLVDIPKDITANKTSYTPAKPLPLKPNPKSYKKKLKDAADLINKSKQPFIFVGGGAGLSGAEANVKALADLIDAPVCDSLMGKGTFPASDERYTGMLGMHGTKVSNFGVNSCDLLIAVGTRFSDRVLGNPKKFAQKAKILQIDIDAAEINKNLMVDLALVGDVNDVLTELLPLVKQKSLPKWKEKIDSLRTAYPQKLDTKKLNGPYIIDRICQKTNQDAIIVTEVGQHQMWTAQYYRFKRPRQFLTSGGLGTMGYGLGAAIGAKKACPNNTVINIAGDGCFRMNCIELMTAAREKLPVIEVIINNHTLGMVRQWQNLFYEKHYSHTTLEDPVDFAAMANAMGATGIRVSKKTELDEALDLALKETGPVVLDCRIDTDDMVWPMVAPGAPISDCFEESDLKE